MAALEDLLQQARIWRGAAPGWAAPTVPTGFANLDAELPGGGWLSGALTEILGSCEGIGELGLLLPALARLTSAGKRVVWLAPPHLPYAPALAAAGIDLAHLAVVRAPGRRDALWAAEQALRAGSCHALLAWLRNARYQELRRLAVAAEASHAFVALFRPLEAARESSPACLRIALEPIAAWACQFTPKVALEPPQALVLEVAASLRHFGGRDSFLAKLRAGLAELGCDASLA